MSKETKGKNSRLELECSNDVYDVIRDAIVCTARKHNYGRYDIAKLITTIYNGDYGYLTNDNDYRDQVRILDEYFVSEYNHRLITFEMIKMIKSFQGTDVYDILTSDVAIVEVLVRTGKNSPASNLCVFSEPLEDNQYDELMTMIESSESMRYAVAVVYDRILTNKG